MRRLTLVLFALSAAISQAQSWEKLITPGMSYRMEIDSKAPRLIHVLRFNVGAPGLFARSEVARGQIFGAPGNDARETMSSMVQRTSAIAGINGDFFPASGEPLGAMVRDGQLLSRPFPGRASIGWGPLGAKIALSDWSGSISLDGAPAIALNGINEDARADQWVLMTDAAAEAKAAAPCTYVVMKMDTLGLNPTGNARGKVVRVIQNQPSVKIPEGHFVLVGQGKTAEVLSETSLIANALIRSNMTGFDWNAIDNVIGGGPMLIKNGQVKIDFQTASFSEKFSTDRHPRTAVGISAQGDLIFAVVDGRQTMSIGCTLPEMASIMQGLGCRDAINLDGGGSSTISIFGQAVNRPSDGIERKVSNGVLFFGPRPENTPPFVIQGPGQLTAGKLQAFRAITSTSQVIPTREVFWSAMGPGGWVDQSGVVRALGEGAITLTATYRGAKNTLSVRVVPVTDEPAP
jgi:hypothetical protein